MPFKTTAIPPTFCTWLNQNAEKIGLSESGNTYTVAGHTFEITYQYPMKVKIKATQPNPDLQWLIELVEAYEQVQKQWGDAREVEVEISYSVPDKKK